MTTALLAKPRAGTQLDGPAVSLPDRSFIDLLHPDGFARRVAIFGSACPPAVAQADRVLDGSPRDCALEVCDAIAIAPDATECLASGWIECCAARAASLLAADGVVYVIAPRRWRPTLVRRLRGYGLIADESHLYVQYGATTAYFIPCRPRLIDHLLATLPIGTRAQRTAARLVVSRPTTARWLHFAAPHAAIALRRPGARPLLQWVSRTYRDRADGGIVTRVKRRGLNARAVLSLFPLDAQSPALTLKAPLSVEAAARMRAELDALQLLGENARRSGARVARGNVATGASGEWAEYTCVSGIPADSYLVNHPESLHRIMERVASWLETWSVSTKRTTVVDSRWIESEVMGPARAVAQAIELRGAYHQWLARGCDAVAGRRIPVVAAHNDLAMSNVLIEDGEPLGIVDWESARDEGLPTADLYYAAGHARAAVRGYRNRSDAFIESTDAGTEYGRFVAQIAARLGNAVELPSDLSRLMIHASALQHAAHEQDKATPAVRPFTDLVRRLSELALCGGTSPCA